jgi:SAM-dependent methyltransferase
MLKGHLQNLYSQLKARFMEERGYEVPPRYQSSFVHWGGGCEVQEIYRRFLSKMPVPSKILLIGAMGGRDYYLLKNLGHEVHVQDIGSQPEIESIWIINIEKGIPTADKTFDAVLIGEVLEHLKEDARALSHIHRVLKDDGVLVVSVPYFNDWEEGHMRIHSPKSARRLLHMTGFSVEDYLERPAIVAPNCLNPLQHGVSLFWWLITGRTAYFFLSRLIGAFSWHFGHATWPRHIRRMSKGYGGYFLCRKSDELQYLSVNRNLYTADAEP